MIMSPRLLKRSSIRSMMKYRNSNLTSMIQLLTLILIHLGSIRKKRNLNQKMLRTNSVLSSMRDNSWNSYLVLMECLQCKWPNVKGRIRSSSTLCHSYLQSHMIESSPTKLLKVPLIQCSLKTSSTTHCFQSGMIGSYRKEM